MTDHQQADTERAARRQGKADRKTARAALRRAGGNAAMAAARLRIQADNDRDLAGELDRRGRPNDAVRQRGERRERAALILDQAKPRPTPFCSEAP